MKTHKFNTGVYSIDSAYKIEGICDTGGEHSRSMIILDGSDFRAFSSAVHEGLHASGIPDRYVHNKDGCDNADRYARFLWRWIHERMEIKAKNKK